MIMDNLTKDKLNNQIVLMRSLMKKVKALTINSLIKKSQKLKTAPRNSDNGTCKKDEKKDRLLLEIHEIKKLHADEITKFALMHRATFSEVARKGFPKERAIARLAEHTLLKNPVSEFRKKYPKWEVQVPSLYHIWEFNKKVMGKNLKIAQQDDILNHKLEKRTLIHTSMSSKSRSKIKPPKFDKPTIYKESHHQTEKVPAETDDVIDACDRPSLNQLTANLKSKRIQDLRKSEGNIEIQRINLDELNNEIPIENTSKSKQRNDDKAVTLKRPHKVKNSFFITSDDDDASSSDELENIESVDYHSGLKVKPGAASLRTRDSFIQNSKLTNRRIRRLSKLAPAFGTSNVARKACNSLASVESTKLASDNLHPSWQAKRKQSNSMLVAFEGKKIKFGDD